MSTTGTGPGGGPSGSADAARGALRLTVDRDKCQGHNRCCRLAPDLFEIDDLGFATATNDGLVRPEDEAKALLAVRNCPEFAITQERMAR